MILGIEDQSPLFLVLLMPSNFYLAQACLFHSPQEDIAILNMYSFFSRSTVEEFHDLAWSLLHVYNIFSLQFSSVSPHIGLNMCHSDKLREMVVPYRHQQQYVPYWYSVSKERCSFQHFLWHQTLKHLLGIPYENRSPVTYDFAKPYLYFNTSYLDRKTPPDAEFQGVSIELCKFVYQRN